MNLRQSYIIASPDIQRAFEKAAEIAAEAVGSGRVTDNPYSHPDVYVVERPSDDKGKQKREIAVGQIRDMVADSIVLPNQSRYKVYIIKDGDYLSRDCQNAALKLLEEPPESVIIIICVTNAERLLPTVRSRCEEVNVVSDIGTADADIDILAEKYIELAASGDAVELWRWCESACSMTVKDMTVFSQCCSEKLTDMLCGRRNVPVMDPDSIIRLERLMEKCQTYLSVNVGVKLLFGMIEAETFN